MRFGFGGALFAESEEFIVQAKRTNARAAPTAAIPLTGFEYEPTAPAHASMSH
jgi:hypothetical protein